MRSHTRQNSRISAGVPSDTRMYLSKVGNGPETRTPFFLKCSTTSTAGRAGVEHDEIGHGIQPQHPRGRLIEKLLPVVGVPADARPHVLGVIECRGGGPGRHDIHTIGQHMGSQDAGRVRRGHGVPDPQSRESVNLGKAARDDHAAVVHRPIDERRVVR